MALRGAARAGQRRAAAAEALQMAERPSSASRGTASNYSCRKYGCVDVRTTFACGCSQLCREDGNCCHDFEEVCDVSPGDNLLLGPWSGCPPGELPKLPRVGPISGIRVNMSIKVLSYNAEAWYVIEERGGNDNSVAQLIEEGGHFDFIGLQEFSNPWHGLSRPGFDAGNLMKDYAFIRAELGGPMGSTIGFRNGSWDLLARGQRYVAEDLTGAGKRIAFWARFKHSVSGDTVFFMNHHGPLPVDSGGACGGLVTAFNLLTVVNESANVGDAIVLVGDFNAGQESETISELSRVLHKSASGSVLGGSDNIFSNLCSANVLHSDSLGSGGSHHEAVFAEFHLPSRGEAIDCSSELTHRSGRPASDDDAGDEDGLNIFQQASDEEELNIFQQGSSGGVEALGPGASGAAPSSSDQSLELPRDEHQGVPMPSETDVEEEAEEERAFLAAKRFAEKQLGEDEIVEAPEGASCARYGCGADYHIEHLCQCNPACHEHDSCCMDYAAVCWQESQDFNVAPTPEQLDEEKDELLAVR